VPPGYRADPAGDFRKLVRTCPHCVRLRHGHVSGGGSAGAGPGGGRCLPASGGLDGGLAAPGSAAGSGEQGGLYEAADVWRQGTSLYARPGVAAVSGQTLTLAGTAEGPEFQYDNMVFSDGRTGRRAAAVRPASASPVNWDVDILRLTDDGALDSEGTLSVLQRVGQPTVNFVPAGNGLLDSAGGEVEQMLFISSGDIKRRDTTGNWVSVPSSEIYQPLIVENGRGEPTAVAPERLEPAEQRNWLTPSMRAWFTTDDKGAYFFLPFTELNHTPVTVEYDDGDTLYQKTINGDEHSVAFTSSLSLHLDRAGGYVYFVNAEFPQGGYAPPGVGVRNNLRLVVQKAINQGKKHIMGTRFCAWFGGAKNTGSRLFVGGNPEEPNRIYWSAPNNPLYFPEDACLYVGGGTQAVTAFAQQDNWLVVFKEHELFALSASGNGVSLIPLHASVGCDCPQTVRLCSGRLVWTTGEGEVYTLARSRAYSAGNVWRVSEPIAPLLAAAGTAALRQASAALWQGYYLLLVGDKVYALQVDNRRYLRLVTASVPAADAAAPWYVWTLPAGCVYRYLLTSETGAVLLGETETSSGERLLGGRAAPRGHDRSDGRDTNAARRRWIAGRRQGARADGHLCKGGGLDGGNCHRIRCAAGTVHARCAGPGAGDAGRAAGAAVRTAGDGARTDLRRICGGLSAGAVRQERRQVYGSGAKHSV